METILNHISDLFFWGSVAAVAWGAALAIGHSLASIDVSPSCRSGTRESRQ